MPKIIVISDFDGTITQKDTLVEILDKFASPKWREIARLVNEGGMGTRIALKKEMDLCKATKKEFTEFLVKHTKIDRGFKRFLKFCQKNKIKFLVVSGGFGLNIETIFKKFKIKKVPYYANKIVFGKNAGRPAKLEFPYKDKICSECGHCKAPYIRSFKNKGYFTVYIGDSVTDRCPAKVADLVFAKHNLAKYCGEKGIEYVPYKSFGDIKNYLLNHRICRI